jgi:hypothetical protein
VAVTVTVVTKPPVQLLVDSATLQAPVGAGVVGLGVVGPGVVGLGVVGLGVVGPGVVGLGVVGLGVVGVGVEALVPSSPRKRMPYAAIPPGSEWP